MLERVKRLLGVVFPEYTFEKWLGEGSFGIVCSVISKTGEKKAIKVSVYKTNSYGLPDDIVKECDILSRINHPYVLHAEQIKHIVYKNKLHNFILMDQAETNLYSYKGDLETKKRLLLQTICGVSALHKNFIVHADIKPHNILVFNTDNDDYKGPNAKVSDFGISRYYHSSLEKAGGNAQTINWTAPENLLKHGYVLPAMDVFSLGLMLLENYTNNPILPINTLFAIRDILGPPPEEFKKYIPDDNKDIYDDLQKPFVKRQFNIEEKALNLALRMMDWLPQNRPTLDEVIRNHYFDDVRKCVNGSNFCAQTIRAEQLQYKDWNPLKNAFISEKQDELKTYYEDYPIIVDMGLTIIDTIMSNKSLEEVSSIVNKKGIDLINTLFIQSCLISANALDNHFYYTFNNDYDLQLKILELTDHKLFYPISNNYCSLPFMKWIDLQSNRNTMTPLEACKRESSIRISYRRS